YKQSPGIPPPYYHARETAIAFMKINRGTVILGSATPDVTTCYRSERGEIQRLRLPDRVMIHREQASQERLAEQVRDLPSPVGQVHADDDALTLPLPPV